MKDADRLARIRRQVDAIAPGRWSLLSDGEGMFIEAHGPMGELTAMARFSADAGMDEMEFAAFAPDTVRFLLGLVDRAIAKLAPARPAQPTKDYAAEAAMKCAEPAFKAFLEAEHGLERPLTDERCAQKVRSLCAVTSRAAFNEPGRAADAWVALRQAFEAWKRRDRG